MANFDQKRGRPMGKKDIISKDILKRIALDMARVLLHLRVDSAEVIETVRERIEDRRADLVAKMQGPDGEFILHIEIQNDNETVMTARMLRYRADILHSGYQQDIRQFVIYIGQPRLTMPGGICQTGLDYRFDIIDMHTVDCQALLTQDTPDVLVLSILCDFKQRPARDVVHFIIGRLQQLTANNEARFREYMRMLEILSTNRNLAETIKEEEKMLSQVQYTQLPSYQLGLEIGESRGEARGEAKGMSGLLSRLLAHRFGPLDDDTLTRLAQATPEQIDRWAQAVLEAGTLAEVFQHH